jgi:hypothetical protein
MKSVILRILAVFAYSAMAVIGGSAIVGGIPVWKAAVLAGISATAHVVEKLARAYADDGVITRTELDAAFQTGASDGPAPSEQPKTVRKVLPKQP